MPFKEEFNSIYNAVKRIAKDEEFYCIRADEIMKGIITDDIFNRISNSFVIIADLTDKNPNVFYELGVAHTIEKKQL
jgi:hypothetical protein